MKVRERRKVFSHDPTVQKFFEDHGDHVQLAHGEVVFHDGATTRHTAAGWEGTSEPSDKDDYELARDIQRYCEKKAELAEFAFRSFKDELESMLKHSSFYGDEEEHHERLIALKKAARKAQKQLNAAEEALDEVTPEKEKRRRAHQAVHARRNEQFRNRVKEINL